MVQVSSKEITPLFIDARGPRFSAALTTIVLSLALVTSNIWIVVAQAIVFAIGASRGPQLTPYAYIFRTIVKPRIKSAVISEDIRPPQFAQSIGLLFVLAAIAGSITDLTPLFVIALSFALAAAFLNAVFNFCLGCEVYLLLLRVR